MADAKHLAQQCTMANHRYEDNLVSCYGVTKTISMDSSIPIDIRHYKFPVSDEKKMVLQNQFPVLKDPANMKEFEVMAKIGINHDFQVSTYLKQKDIDSTVRYMTQTANETEVFTEVYLLSSKLTPLTIYANHTNVTVEFVVCLARRLLAICRDMREVGVIHRNINPYCIYFDENDRLVLGGFECASMKNECPVKKPYLHVCHAAPPVLDGEVGGEECDAYSIASIMASFFLGQDIRTNPSGRLSDNIPIAIREAIALGLSLKPENVAKFRKALDRIYKVGKNTFWTSPVSSMLNSVGGVVIPEVDLSQARSAVTEAVDYIDSGLNSVPETEYAQPVAPIKKNNRKGNVLSFLLGAITMGGLLAAALFYFGVI